MTRMTGRRAMLEMLRAEGVEYIFGNPGTSESPIMHELESFPELKYVLVLQEGVAVGMADAYARATGRPAFVNLHIETGLANGISLLHNAYAGGTPLVLSAGNKDIRELAPRPDRPGRDGASVHQVDGRGHPSRSGAVRDAAGLQRGEDAAHGAYLRRVLRQRAGRRGPT